MDTEENKPKNPRDLTPSEPMAPLMIGGEYSKRIGSKAKSRRAGEQHGPNIGARPDARWFKSDIGIG